MSRINRSCLRLQPFNSRCDFEYMYSIMSRLSYLKNSTYILAKK